MQKSQNQKNKTDDMSSHYSVFIVLADNIVWYNSFCLVSWINLGQFLMLVEARPDIYCLKLQRTMSQVRQNQLTLGQDWKTNEWRRAFIYKTVKYYYAGFIFHLHAVHYSNIFYDLYINLQTHNIKRINLPPNYSTLVFILNSWRKTMVDLACTNKIHSWTEIDQSAMKV